MTTTQTGFTTQQAEVLVKIMVRMTNSNMDVIYNDMVTKVQQVRVQDCVFIHNKHDFSPCFFSVCPHWTRISVFMLYIKRKVKTCQKQQKAYSDDLFQNDVVCGG